VDPSELEPRLLRMGCKIVDFGNACWTDRQFSENIQTRQYRAPEVRMLGSRGVGRVLPNRDGCT
jgi:serine/threonine protein kinase